MTKVLSFSNVMRVGKLGLVGGCLIAIVAGCGSRLQTTIMSGTEPPAKPQVAKLESVTPRAEAAVQTPVQAEKIIGIPPIDIPVEEPARPVLRPSASADIFATPRTGGATPRTGGAIPPTGGATPPTGVVEPAVPAPLEAPLVAEQVVPPSPVMATVPSQIAAQEAPKELGIPPISFEPEMPAFPTIREEAPPPEEPVQIAKAVTAAPEAVESKTEVLLKALGDVYFDYDRFTIRKDAIPVLQENAHALVAALSDKNIVIEGHCDERGTESYNMVLGKRRGNAVKEFLVDLGVPGDKLQVMSYGKEKPFCTDQNEECWQENRRGHFIVQ